MKKLKSLKSLKIILLSLSVMFFVVITIYNIWYFAKYNIPIIKQSPEDSTTIVLISSATELLIMFFLFITLFFGLINLLNKNLKTNKKEIFTTTILLSLSLVVLVISSYFLTDNIINSSLPLIDECSANGWMETVRVLQLGIRWNIFTQITIWLNFVFATFFAVSWLKRKPITD